VNATVVPSRVLQLAGPATQAAGGAPEQPVPPAAVVSAGGPDRCARSAVQPPGAERALRKRQRMTRGCGAQGRLSELSMVYLNNLLSLPLAAALAAATGELAGVAADAALRRPAVVAAALASALLAFCISFTALWRAPSASYPVQGHTLRLRAAGQVIQQYVHDRLAACSPAAAPGQHSGMPCCSRRAPAACAARPPCGSVTLIARQARAAAQVPEHHHGHGVQPGGEPEQNPARAYLHRALPPARGRVQPGQHPGRPSRRRAVHHDAVTAGARAGRGWARRCGSGCSECSGAGVRG